MYLFPPFVVEIGPATSITILSSVIQPVSTTVAQGKPSVSENHQSKHTSHISCTNSWHYSSWLTQQKHPCVLSMVFYTLKDSTETPTSISGTSFSEVILRYHLCSNHEFQNHASHSNPWHSKFIRFSRSSSSESCGS